MFSFPSRGLLALGLFLALSSPTLAQGDDRGSDAERFLILMQGHTMGGFSGSGPSSAFGVSVADVGSVNPAALGTFERPAVGLAYQLETPIPEGYVAGIGYDALNDARPQSAAVVVPLGAWALGVSYNQRYAAEMDFGHIPQQTVGNPEIDPDLTYEATWTSRLETISPQIAYRSVLRNGNELAVGLRLGLGYGQYESRLDSATVSLADWGTQVALGVSYRVPEAYGLAVYYESTLRVEGDVDREIRFLPDSAPTMITVPYADAIPARLGFSIELEASPALHLGVDLTRVFWKSAWGGGDQLKDNSEAAAWARLDLSDRSLVSFGLLAQDRNRWNNGIDEIFGYSGRAIYLTAGGAITFDRFRLDAVVADSRLLSAEQHRQTLLKVGASVRL